MPSVPNPKITSAFAAIVGTDAVFTDPADCWVYGYDNSRRHALPEWVVFATSHEQVVEITRLCHAHRIPLTARGAGTGTPGGSIPIEGGVVLSLERMNKIVRCDPGNRIIVVEPGVLNATVQRAAAEFGFFWPPDPSSAAYCTIGGNLAYNSAGPRAVKYGTPRENTLGLRAVTGDGQTIHTGVCTTKGVVGYDLTRLIIGSEGTLAIITEATLKLTPLPETQRSCCAIYADIHSAANAVAQIMSQPTTPSMLEFMDSSAIDLIRSQVTIPLPKEARALLLIEVDGLTSSMPHALAAIEQAASSSGLLAFHVAKNAEEAAALLQLRKSLSPALRNIAPKKINEDVVVPVTQIPTLLSKLEKLAEKHEIKIVSFGHAGNGNLHVNLLIDPDDPQQVQQATTCLNTLFADVLALGGTLSGEHGVGLEKRPFISAEIDENTLALMRRIKEQFDPKQILNPGKIF